MKREYMWGGPLISNKEKRVFSYVPEDQEFEAPICVYKGFDPSQKKKSYYTITFEANDCVVKFHETSKQGLDRIENIMRYEHSDKYQKANSLLAHMLNNMDVVDFRKIAGIFFGRGIDVGQEMLKKQLRNLLDVK